MSQPAVTIRETDGALGVLPSGQRYFAIAGVSSSGPLNTPAAYARTKDIIALFGAGPLVELAAFYVSVFKRPVVVIRTGSTEAGTVSDVESVATGTSEVTLDESPAPAPKDDHEVVLRFVTGTTAVGTAGATYQISFDGGRNYGPVTQLGTAATIAVAEAGISFELDTGDIDAGDKHTVVTTAPNFNAAELLAALEALRLTAIDWEGFTPAGPINAACFDNLELKFAEFLAGGKYCYWVGSTRMPTPGETPAQYKTALDGIFGNKATKFGGVVAGAQKLPSAVSGRNYRRPFGFSVASLQASVPEHINIADVSLGPLVGSAIRNDNGNPDEHDESIYPGLDDSRFITARTWEGYPGVYVNRPRLFSTPGSDFQLVLHRRVLNLGHAALRRYFIRRLNSPVLIDKVTGFILESEAREIEAGAIAAMRSLLLATPKASDVRFELSRTDNLLATSTLTGQGGVLPLGYPEFIDLDLGFYNPVNAQIAA